jgi:hypothetical protein
LRSRIPTKPTPAVSSTAGVVVYGISRTVANEIEPKTANNPER